MTLSCCWYARIFLLDPFWGLASRDPCALWLHNLGCGRLVGVGRTDRKGWVKASVWESPVVLWVVLEPAESSVHTYQCQVGLGRGQVLGIGMEHCICISNFGRSACVPDYLPSVA